MKYKNAIISTGKDILIVFICFFIFMFLSGGGTQNVLAAEDEVYHHARCKWRESS